MLHILRPVGILRKHWKLSIAAIFSLSIAMTLGVVALSIGNTFLLLPPAGADPDRLVMIYAQHPGEDSDLISYPDYDYFRKNNHAFTDIAATPNSINVNFSMGSNGKFEVVSRPVSTTIFRCSASGRISAAFSHPVTTGLKTKSAY